MPVLTRGAAAAAAALAACALYSRSAVTRLEKRYRPVGRRVPVPGGALHLVDLVPRRRPPRQTVVLLHGASGNLADMVLSLAVPLSRRYRVIAVDRPGHGWSDRPGGAADASPARQAELIHAALKRIGVRRAIIVGHSWSGALACRFALAHRDLCSGVVLVAAATHPWPGGVAWYYSSAAHPLISPFFLRTLVAPLGLASIERVVRTIFAPQEPVPGYVESIGAGLLMRPSQFRANAQDMTGLHAFVTEQSPRYGAIDVPVGIVTGTADPIVPDLHSRTIHEQIRGSRLTLLPGIGHMPHHVATDHVVAEIDAVACRVEERERARVAA
jgi:pimeloyl-ACP methyl ester carboxylesterase